MVLITATGMADYLRSSPSSSSASSLDSPSLPIRSSSSALTDPPSQLFLPHEGTRVYHDKDNHGDDNRTGMLFTPSISAEGPLCSSSTITTRRMRGDVSSSTRANIIGCSHGEPGDAGADPTRGDSITVNSSLLMMMMKQLESLQHEVQELRLERAEQAASQHIAAIAPSSSSSSQAAALPTSSLVPSLPSSKTCAILKTVTTQFNADDSLHELAKNKPPEENQLVDVEGSKVSTIVVPQSAVVMIFDNLDNPEKVNQMRNVLHGLLVNKDSNNSRETSSPRGHDVPGTSTNIDEHYVDEEEENQFDEYEEWYTNATQMLVDVFCEHACMGYRVPIVRKSDIGSLLKKHFPTKFQRPGSVRHFLMDTIAMGILKETMYGSCKRVQLVSQPTTSPMGCRNTATMKRNPIDPPRPGPPIL